MVRVGQIPQRRRGVVTGGQSVPVRAERHREERTQEGGAGVDRTGKGGEDTRWGGMMGIGQIPQARRGVVAAGG
jgi:hypothetical protein